MNRITRWRLILGDGSEQLGALSGEDQQRAELLNFLYSRETVGGFRDYDDRTSGGGSGHEKGAGAAPSQLTIPDWINGIRDLFPNRVSERLEADALQRYGIHEVLTNPETLKTITPSETLLKAILSTKHLMDQETLAIARKFVRLVVDQIVEKLRSDIRDAATGKKNPFRRSRRKIAADFDPKATIRANLKHYSAERDQLVIQNPLFSSRTRRHWERWQIITLVDQSGSMVDSVIHAAVTASIFHGLPGLDSHLVAFDTAVVDLTSDVMDPVETLMKVQLGGGTFIHQAMEYSEKLVKTPSRTMIVLISDLYEGGTPGSLENSVRRLVASDAKVLVLGALNDQGKADVDMAMARRLTKLGAEYGAMTPYELATWVGEVMG